MKPLASHAPRALFTLGLVAAACLAQAQTAPNIGDALRQIPAQPAQPAPALPRVAAPAFEAPMTKLPGGPSVEVKSFEITGNRELGTDALQAQLTADVGKAYTLPELEALASKLTRYYRSQGYFVARVYVPQQEVVNGRLTLRAVEGNYGRFVLDNQSRVRDDIVQGMLDDVKKYDIVSLDTLERAMLIINDTPGSQVVSAEVMPGQAVGSSDFTVRTVATPAHRGFVMLDNHGTLATGKLRASGNWDWNSPTGRGDRLNVSGLVSEDQGLLNGRVAYSVSLAPNGLRGEVAAGRTSYEVSPNFFASNTPPSVTGTADSLEVGLTYPIRRIRAQTIEASLGYAHKRLEDVVDAGANARLVTPKRTDALTAALNLRDEGFLLGLDGLTQASASLTLGRLSISGDALQADQAANGPQTHGDFSKFNLSVSRVSLLPAQFSLTVAAKLQRALGKNLDGSERLGVAGVGGVAAYPSAELSGSNAAFLRVELARPLPSWGGLTHQWSLLADWAQAQPTRQDPQRTLRDLALGWTAQHAAGFLVKAYLAHRLGGTPAQSESTPDTKLWLQAGWTF